MPVSGLWSSVVSLIHEVLQAVEDALMDAGYDGTIDNGSYIFCGAATVSPGQEPPLRCFPN
jgi:hypothetical protein